MIEAALTIAEIDRHLSALLDERLGDWWSTDCDGCERGGRDRNRTRRVDVAQQPRLKQEALQCVLEGLLLQPGIRRISYVLLLVVRSGLRFCQDLIDGDFTHISLRTQSIIWLRRRRFS